MHIRQALPEDAPLLAPLARETYVQHFASIWSAQGLADFLEREFALPELQRGLASPDQAWYLASDEDGLCGYAKVNWPRIEPHSGRVGAELQKIYLLQSKVGHGIGLRLLEHVMQRARERGEASLWLNVLATNDGARRFYDRQGFVALGTSAFTAGITPIAMIAMARTLPAPQ